MIFNRNKLSLPSPEQALPGRDTSIVPKTDHTVLGVPLIPPYPENTDICYFGMGCFWGAEKLFWQLPGIYTTAVGYGAGYTPNPTYEEVCSGRTGHNEIVKVVFSTDKISFSELLRVFWENHNPCEGMRQGNDIGTQYRSGIYVTTPQQRQEAELSQKAYNRVLKEQGLNPSTSEVVDDISFYYAEDYHQQYLAKNPLGYCPNHGCDATGLPRLPTG